MKEITQEVCDWLENKNTAAGFNTKKYIISNDVRIAKPNTDNLWVVYSKEPLPKYVQTALNSSHNLINYVRG